jgi:hypothetical protein
MGAAVPSPSAAATTATAAAAAIPIAVAEAAAAATSLREATAELDLLQRAPSKERKKSSKKPYVKKGVKTTPAANLTGEHLKELSKPFAGDNTTNNNFLTAAVGGFLGSFFGTTVSNSLIKDYDHAGISGPPNSRFMGRYNEPVDSRWTRGGPSPRRPSSRRVEEYNRGEPDAVRRPRKNYEVNNLHRIRNKTTHTEDCDNDCECSED